MGGYLMALNFTGGTASTELNEGDPISAIDVPTDMAHNDK